jgi:hypothetical protein
VGLGRGTLSLGSTIEELLERKSSGSSLENREYGRKDPSRWPRGTLYPQKLAITSPTSGGRSVGIVRSRSRATEFSFVGFWYVTCLFKKKRNLSGFSNPIIALKDKYNFWVFCRWMTVLSFDFLNKGATITFLIIYFSTSYITKISIYLCSKFCLLMLAFASLFRIID